MTTLTTPTTAGVHNDSSTVAPHSPEPNAWDCTRNVVYVVISCVTLMYCTWLLVAALTRRQVRAQRATTFVACTAASLGLLSLISLACNIYFMAWRVAEGALWPCVLLTLGLRCLHLVAHFSLATVALERYLAVCWPLRYPALLTRTRCLWLTLTCWASPCLLFLLPCADLLKQVCINKQFLLRLRVVYGISLLLGMLFTLLLYLMVALEFRKKTSVSCWGSGGKVIEERLVWKRTSRAALVVLSFYIPLLLSQVVLPNLEAMTVYKDVANFTNRVMLLVLVVVCRPPLPQAPRPEPSTELKHKPPQAQAPRPEPSTGLQHKRPLPPC